jgi:hypothetical protein
MLDKIKDKMSSLPGMSSMPGMGGGKDKKKAPPQAPGMQGALGQIAQTEGAIGTVDAGGVATGIEAGFAQAGA